MRRIRVLLSKVGLDGHERGVMVVASALRDAGMEVVYLGLHKSPAEIVEAAIQEDVDVVGISSLADAHVTLAPRVVADLRARGAEDICVILGGFIQPEDIAQLKEQGIAEVFGIGTRLGDIVRYIQDKVAKEPVSA